MHQLHEVRGILPEKQPQRSGGQEEHPEKDARCRGGFRILRGAFPRRRASVLADETRVQYPASGWHHPDGKPQRKQHSRISDSGERHSIAVLRRNAPSPEGRESQIETQAHRRGIRHQGCIRRGDR